MSPLGHFDTGYALANSSTMSTSSCRDLRLLILWNAFTILTDPDVCMNPKALSELLTPRSAACGAASEEECDRDFKRLRDPLQPPSADPIDTFLVLLDLLKSHSDPIRELSLRETTFKPPCAHASSDFRITAIGSSCGTCLSDFLGDFISCLPLPFWRSLRR